MITQENSNRVILIVKSSPESLSAAESFLRNRNWVVFSVTEITAALRLVVEFKKMYVFVSVDHTDKKVRHLPRLLSDTYPITPVAFSESQTATSFAAIQEMGLKYNLSHPVSGPAIERMIFRIDKEVVPKVPLQVVPTVTPAAVQETNATAKMTFGFLESPHFKGYVVGALPASASSGEDMLRARVRTKLQQFLTQNGVENASEASRLLRYTTMPPEDWAYEYGDFLAKSVQSADDVAMAFFQNPPRRLVFSESKSDTMTSFDLEHIKDDSVLPFDVYIYLPHNDKYILYTPQGRTFFGSQRKRLLDSGISEVHVKVEAKA